MSQTNPGASHGTYDQRARYDALMEAVRSRMTTRQFDPACGVQREHYDLILEAAGHAPSGANSQPWHFIVVTDPETKRRIADYFVEEQRHRAKLKMKFRMPRPSANTAPAAIATAT